MADATERVLERALVDCAALRKEVASLKAEREAYFKRRVEGPIAVSTARDKACGILEFKVVAGPLIVVSEIAEEVLAQSCREDVLRHVAGAVADRIAGMLGQRIAPLLRQALEAG